MNEIVQWPREYVGYPSSSQPPPNCRKLNDRVKLGERYTLWEEENFPSLKERLKVALRVAASVLSIFTVLIPVFALICYKQEYVNNFYAHRRYKVLTVDTSVMTDNLTQNDINGLTSSDLVKNKPRDLTMTQSNLNEEMGDNGVETGHNMYSESAEPYPRTFAEVSFYAHTTIDKHFNPTRPFIEIEQKEHLETLELSRPPTFPVGSLIGKGDHSSVYVHATDTERAVKVYTTVEEAQREFEVGIVLGKCPYFVKFHEFIEDSEFGIIVMDRIRGSTVRALEYQQTISVQTAIQLIEQLQEACSYLYNIETTWKDIHAENLFLINDLQDLRIIDFGNWKKCVDCRDRASALLFEAIRGVKAIIEILSPKLKPYKFLTIPKGFFGDVFLSPSQEATAHRVETSADSADINSPDNTSAIGQEMFPSQFYEQLPQEEDLENPIEEERRWIETLCKKIEEAPAEKMPELIHSYFDAVISSLKEKQS